MRFTYQIVVLSDYDYDTFVLLLPTVAIKRTLYTEGY